MVQRQVQLAHGEHARVDEQFYRPLFLNSYFAFEETQWIPRSQAHLAQSVDTPLPTVQTAAPAQPHVRPEAETALHPDVRGLRKGAFHRSLRVERRRQLLP